MLSRVIDTIVFGKIELSYLNNQKIKILYEQNQIRKVRIYR